MEHDENDESRVDPYLRKRGVLDPNITLLILMGMIMGAVIAVAILSR